MRFEEYNIHPKIKRSLADLGFKRPTDIQFKSIPSILKGEDLLAIAQTGTGKTAAFAIPLIDMIIRKKKERHRSGGILSLVMAPSHELAIQINSVFTSIAKHTSVTSMAVIGGVDQDPQIEKLEKGVDIVIATPGRMFDLISQGYLVTDTIELLVLDEADYMLDLGFAKDIKDILYKLPRRRQTLFFSATINDKIKRAAYKIVRGNAIRIQLSPKDPVSKNVDHFVLFVEMDHKRFFLERVIHENPDTKVIAFVRTKVRAERVSKAMARVGIDSLTIHGDKDQEERSDVLKQFKEGNIKLLIGTDVSARGIDIPEVGIVINYDLPDDPENYVHRVGRTGRAKRRGFAYSFCAEQERETLDQVQGYLQSDIQVIETSAIDYTDTLNIEMDRKYDFKALIDAEEAQDQKFKKKKKKKNN